MLSRSLTSLKLWQDYKEGEIMNISLILSVLVFYPFVGGLLAYLAGRKSESLRNKIASFVAVSELAIMIYLVMTLK